MDDDLASNVSWSAASETDRMLFTVLGNSERLDLERLPRASHGSRRRDEDHSPPRIEELPAISEEEAGTGGGTSREMWDEPQRDEPQRDEPQRDRHAEERHAEERSEAPPLSWAGAEAGADEYYYARGGGESATYSRGDDASRPYEDPPLPPAPEVAEADRPTDGYAAVFDADLCPPAPSSSRDEMFEKQSALLDLQQLEQMRGVRLSRRFTMEDSLEEITLELRRHVLMLDERENVSMMKSGLKMVFTGIEALNTRFHLLDLEGWSSQACSELDKQDVNLSRIYRKYWKRSTSSSPEAEILFAVASSMGFYHMKRSMTRHMMERATGGGAAARGGSRGGRRAPPRPVTPDTSDDEGVPPRAR